MRLHRLLTLALLPIATLLRASEPAAPAPTPGDVLSTLERVAAWQIANPDARLQTAPADSKWQRTLKPDPISWVVAPFHIGLLELDKISEDPRWRAHVRSVGETAGWNIATEHRSIYFADNHCITQAYLELYRTERRTEFLAPSRKAFDQVIAQPAPIPVDIRIGDRSLDRWTWCDALFMAPAALAEMTDVTGDARYLEFMNQEWWATTAALYSPRHGFYFRDSRFIDRKSPNGGPIFWSRGNGWVAAGLARVLDRLPADHRDRSRYEKLYQEIAAALLRAQQPDGFWRVSLLDPENYPAKESSGTAFHTFALAWGVNTGRLDPAVARPAVLRGWAALVSCVTEDGRFTHAQPIGAAPDIIPDGHTEPFATGAFLLAGVEVHRLVGGEPARRAFARFVPERSDDFAWENDLVAFRTYGPALRAGPEDSGIDCWLKRTKLPVIDKWYAGHLEGVSYHTDHGEGYDPYHVGSSRGCGGTALWRDGKLVTSDTFVSHRIVSADPREMVFVLSYTYDTAVPSDKSLVIDEEKTITIRPGTPFYESVSRFTRNGVPLSNLEVAVGVTTHDGKAAARLETKSGWIACWETIDGKGLGTAALADPASVISAQLIEPAGKDTGHAVLILRTDANGVVRHRAGFGWEGSGFVRTADEWHAVLAAESTR